MYDREAREETRKLHCKLEFYRPGFGHYWNGCEIDLTETIFNESLHWYDSPIYYVECVIADLKRNGHYITFDDTFKFKIITSIMRIDLESFIINPDVIDLSRFAFNPNINLDNVRNRINNEINNEGIIPINEEKTFKNDLCTICLERIPNVLFCLCGHICVCEKCNEIKKLNSRPVCKTENNILRIIE